MAKSKGITKQDATRQDPTSLDPTQQDSTPQNLAPLDQGKLPKFNEVATCAKCGGTQIKARYVNDEQGERIERECERCKYCWPEATLDA